MGWFKLLEFDSELSQDIFYHIGFYSYVPTSDKNNPVLQIECKYLLQEAENHIQDYVMEQNALGLKVLSILFLREFLTVLQVIHGYVSF